MLGAKEITAHALLGMHTIGSSALPQTINFMTFSTLCIPLSQVQMFMIMVYNKSMLIILDTVHHLGFFFFSQHFCHCIIKFTVSWTAYKQLVSILLPADI